MLALCCLILGLPYFMLALYCLILGLPCLPLGLYCLILGLPCFMLALYCLILGLCHLTLRLHRHISWGSTILCQLLVIACDEGLELPKYHWQELP